MQKKQFIFCSNSFVFLDLKKHKKNKKDDIKNIKLL